MKNKNSIALFYFLYKLRFAVKPILAEYNKYFLAGTLLNCMLFVILQNHMKTGRQYKKIEKFEPTQH